MADIVLAVETRVTSSRSWKTAGTEDGRDRYHGTKTRKCLIFAEMGKEPRKQFASKAVLSTTPIGWTPVLYDLDSDEGQSILAAVKKDAELMAEDLFIADMNGRLLEKLVEIKGESFVFKYSQAHINEFSGPILDILEWTEHKVKCAGMDAEGMKRISSAARICSAIRICCLQIKLEKFSEESA
ncbi:hypothetical protein KCU65_g9367, partial [Aureobasidium melanogenum]